MSPYFPRISRRKCEFSSARAHVYKKKDRLLSDNFVNEEIKDWKAFLEGNDMEQDVMLFKKHARVGRPLAQLQQFEKKIGCFHPVDS